jgi:predicted RecB family nuclease
MSFETVLLDSSLPDPDRSPSSVTQLSDSVKRPHNAYNLFYSERLQIEKDLHPDLTGNEVSHLIGKTWSEMSEDARRPYRERALDIREKFKEEFPDYHYKKSNKRKRRLDQVEGRTETPQKCSMVELSLKNLFTYLGSQLIASYLPQNKMLMDEAATIVRGALAGGGFEDSMDPMRDG